MALIIVLAVMNGFETNLKEKIIGTYAHIVIMKAGQEGMDHYEEMAKRIEDIQGVTSVSPSSTNKSCSLPSRVFSGCPKRD